MTQGHFGTISLTKAARGTVASLPHWLFPVGVFFVLLNGLALLGTVIFPPQLKFEQAALGSNFGSSCNVYYQCGQVFIPLTAIHHAPFD